MGNDIKCDCQLCQLEDWQAVLFSVLMLVYCNFFQNLSVNLFCDGEKTDDQYGYGIAQARNQRIKNPEHICSVFPLCDVGFVSQASVRPIFFKTATGFHCLRKMIILAVIPIRL